MAEESSQDATGAVKRRGRPPLEVDRALRSSVNVSLPTPIHDRLIQRANRERTTVSALVRRWVIARQP